MISVTGKNFRRKFPPSSLYHPTISDGALAQMHFVFVLLWLSGNAPNRAHPLGDSFAVRKLSLLQKASFDGNPFSAMHPSLLMLSSSSLQLSCHLVLLERPHIAYPYGKNCLLSRRPPSIGGNFLPCRVGGSLYLGMNANRRIRTSHSFRPQKNNIAVIVARTSGCDGLPK